MPSWQELQLLTKKLQAITNSVLAKEKELKAKYKSAIENYYKQKYSLLFYRENNVRYFGFAGRETPTPRKKLKIVFSELIIGYHKIKKYLFLIRKDLSLQLALIKALDKNEEVVIAKLFVNCFFDNVSSIISEAFINLIQKLIEKEVLMHPCPFASSFMSIDSFIGKLIAELIKTSDITEYVAFAFKDIINNLDANEVSKIKLTFEDDKNKKKALVAGWNRNNNIGFEILEKQELKDDYRKYMMESVNSYIIDNDFMKNSSSFSSTITSNKNSFNSLNDNYKNMTISHVLSNAYPKSSNSSNSIQIHISNASMAPKAESFNSCNQRIKDIYNAINLNSITERRMRLRHHREEKHTIKEFYADILQAMTNNPEIYSTNSLSKLFIKSSEKSLDNFNQTLQTIVHVVQQILTKLSNTNCIPELIRLIGRMIFTSVKQSNLNAKHYLVLSYVGKFFYEKCISPLMYLPEIYGTEVENKILSINTRAIIVVVNLVLSHLFSFELFQMTISPLYTPLNHHFIQWFPLVIDILESLIKDNATDTFDHTIQMANFESFCISIANINLLIDKASFLLENEKSNKDLLEIKKMLIEEGEDTHFLFLADEFNPPILSQYEIMKLKGKLLEYGDDHNYIDEIVYSIYQLFLHLPFTLTKEEIDSESLFNDINQKLQFCIDYNTISTVTTLPLSWYSNYIVCHLNQLPIEYTDNNYKGLYDKIYSETKAMFERLQARDYVLSYDLTYELNTVLAKIQKTFSHKQKMKALQVDIFRFNFIEITPIPICLMSGEDVIQYENKLKCNLNKIDPDSLILLPQERCVHMQLRTLLKISYQEDEIAFRNVCHFNTIQGFINKFKQYSLFCEDINWNDSNSNRKGENNSKFNLNDINKSKKTNDILFNYIEYIKHSLTNSILLPFYDLKNQEKVINELKEEIQEYILQKIWDPNNIPKYLREENEMFHLTCIKLSWIDPEIHLKIRKEHISSHHIQIAIDFLKEIDNAKTPGSIIKLFDKATDILMKIFIFSLNKCEIGADDLNPIYLYLLIQIKPLKMISQFSFCKLFIQQKNLLGKNGYIMTTLEWVIGCIKEINHETFSIDREEFDSKSLESSMQFFEGI